MVKNNIKLIRVTTVPVSFKTLLKGQLVYMRNQGFDPLMVSADGEEVEQIVREQMTPHISLPLTRKITPFSDLKAIYQFYRLCRQRKPDIVHSHTPKAGFVAMIGAWLAGIKIRLHTVAGLPLMESTGMKRWVLEFVEKLTYRFSTQVYSNSFQLREFIIANNFCNELKVKVIGNGSSNGIDTNYYSISDDLRISSEEIRKLHGLSSEDFIYIYVGRVVFDKGITELINAFKIISQNKPNCKLIIVGGLEQELNPLPDDILFEIGNNKNIKFLGFQEDVRPYFLVSDVLVFPSYREGLPNVPMQACCLGLPVIATNINGNNEIVIHGENGLLVPVKDTSALAEAMLLIANDYELIAKFKSNARDIIINKYDQKFLWEELVKEYNHNLKV